MTYETPRPAETGWGIIRYLPGSGRAPDEDIAAFDGWYFIKDWADAVYADWCARYPNFIVALVEQDRTRWLDDPQPPSTFEKRAAARALIERAHKLITVEEPGGSA